MNKILASVLGLSVACSAFAVPHYPGGITVTTSNAYSLRSAYDASDIITYLSPMNEDLALLKQHQKFGNDTKNASGLSYPNKAIVEVSADAALTNAMGSGIVDPTKSSNTVFFNNLYLSDAKLNFNAFITPWLGAFVEVGKSGPYDNAANFSRAWFTIGNLDVSPFYFTAGQMHLPFGKFSSYMVSTPITKAIFAISAPVALFGYSKGGLYAESYVNSAGISRPTTGAHTPDPVSFGVNTGYNFTKGNYNADFGAGYNYDINNAGAFLGLSTVSPWSAFDVHSEESLQLTRWNIAAKAEFLSTIGGSSGKSSLLYNSKSATPMALHVELDANNTAAEKPYGLFLAYGQSWHALGFNTAKTKHNFYSSATIIPQTMIATGFNASLWQDTIASLEYRHNFLYNADAQSSIKQSGKQENIVTMQIAAYL